MLSATGMFECSPRHHDVECNEPLGFLIRLLYQLTAWLNLHHLVVNWFGYSHRMSQRELNRDLRDLRLETECN